MSSSVHSDKLCWVVNCCFFLVSGNHKHLPTSHSTDVERLAVEPRLQRPRPLPMPRVPPGDSRRVSPGALPAVPLPVLAHYLEGPPVWVPPFDQLGRHRCSRQVWRTGSDKLFADDRDHPAVSADHGVGLWVVQDGRDVHPSGMWSWWTLSSVLMSFKLCLFK